MITFSVANRAVLFSAGNAKKKRPFSFFDIAVLFSAGNVKKNVFTVFTVPIVTIDAFLSRTIVNLREGGRVATDIKKHTTSHHHRLNLNHILNLNVVNPASQ